MPGPNPVYHLISSLGRGGRERQLSILYRYTKNTPLQIRIICFKRTRDSYLDEYDMNTDVIFLKSHHPVKRFFEIRSILREAKADFIWTWGGLEAPYGLFLGLFSKVTHINGSIRHGIIKMKLTHIRRMIVLHLSKYRIANSAAGLKANFLRKGFVWYNGLDDRFFDVTGSSENQEELRSLLGLEKDKVTLISVANLVPYKDYHTVIDAVQRLKKQGIPVYYLIVGEGSERPGIEAAIEAKGLTGQVKLLGRRKDVSDLLQLSDIFIHSSMGEGCSNAILEAMAAGKPVIATDVGGTAEIVDQSNALLFPFKDGAMLEKHLVTLIQDRDLLTRMGTNSSEIARDRFSARQMVDNYSAILDRISKK